VVVKCWMLLWAEYVAGSEKAQYAYRATSFLGESF